MPVLDIPHRVVHFKDGSIPPFPARVRVEAQLAPKEQFGEATLSGRLSVTPHGHKVELHADMWHGGIRRRPGGKLPKPSVRTNLFDLELSIEGSIASVEGEVRAAIGLEHCISMVATDLPAFLSSALSGPVAVSEVWGTVGDRFFEVSVKGTFEDVVRTIDAPKSVAETARVLSGLPESAAPRMFAAWRYVNHARWLAYQALFPGQFAGEQLLNLSKAVELLVPHQGSVDRLREALERLGLNSDVIELFAALKHVRNQVDVGHATVEVLNAKEHRDVHRFLLYMNELVAWLTLHVAVAVADGRCDMPLGKGSGGKPNKTLARIEPLLDRVNPLQPDTFLTR